MEPTPSLFRTGHLRVDAAAPGNYLLSVTAQDGATGTEVNNTSGIPLPVPRLPPSPSSPSPASPQPINTPITLTADGDGRGAVQYQFWLYNPAATPAWSQLQAYSSTATCLWTPTTPGNYLLSVTARTASPARERITPLVYHYRGARSRPSPLPPSPASPQPANTPITLTATATGGTNVQYQFWVYNPAATPAWSQLQAFSARTPASGRRHAGQLSALHHRAGWHYRYDGEYHALVYHTVEENEKEKEKE